MAERGMLAMWAAAEKVGAAVDAAAPDDVACAQEKDMVLLIHEHGTHYAALNAAAGAGIRVRIRVRVGEAVKEEPYPSPGQEPTWPASAFS